MYPNLYTLCIFIAIAQSVSCFFSPCQDSSRSVLLSDDECEDLFFEPSERESDLGGTNLIANDTVLKISPANTIWSRVFLRLSLQDNPKKRLCLRLQKDQVTSACFNFTQKAHNKSFVLEYKAENPPESSSRKFIFSGLPTEVPLFTYVDVTDTSMLILKTQFPQQFNQACSHQVEVFQEKNNVTKLIDLESHSTTRDITSKFYTYNEEGFYYFHLIVDDGQDHGWEIKTPKIYIARKSTRVVIGIVAASFILPFVLFIFHIFTKKYSIDEIQEEAIIVAYKSSHKKHNDVVVTLAALVEKFSRHRVDVRLVDLSKLSKTDTAYLTIAKRVIYVTPPKTEPEAFSWGKILGDKENYAVIFRYCGDNLPDFYDCSRVFRLFDDFDQFLLSLKLMSPYHNSLYRDLLNKTEEAELDGGSGDVPKIVIVTDEDQENQALMDPKLIM